jgi:hypothetical protein
MRGEEECRYSIHSCQENRYVIYFLLLSSQYPATGGGVIMLEYIISFIVSVVAGIVAYYICKWLDGDNKDDK